ncbi:16S rRNA (guanine(966)-N(2))-methyltransferase RsmD [Tepidamorphus sp. 3E244]|uniref:16S rRNA (guanine(966)-N(2))-methyltransferase RsmD n=1 Tax=Tepidamorphus sp. 3E244 TaxID=3385498 RepID=UPI0038FC47BE
MRVVGGKFKGKALAAPTSNTIRPTSDRLREAVFNILEHAHDDVVDGARVLDLFAGTGALGIEALSRGARSALFVDDGLEARGLIRRNLESLGIMGLARISKRDVAHLGPANAQGGFTLAFADPPYNKGLGTKALNALANGQWLADGALVVVEEAKGAEMSVPDTFEALETRAYGDTQVTFLRFTA